MIKVIEKKPVPTELVTCDNCESILEYGNADLRQRYDDGYSALYSAIHHYEFTCPVCGCIVRAHWIVKKKIEKEL